MRCARWRLVASVVGALSVVAMGGCSFLYESNVPEGCDIEDGDGDGFLSLECGGNDCDDDDELINPGATEVCDELGIDEDCNPMTVGADEDGDGQASLDCCNVSDDGLDSACGRDCNDQNPDVFAGAVEACDGFDTDCDNEIDEGTEDLTFFPDCDGDSAGDELRIAEVGCQAPDEPPVCEVSTGVETWAQNASDCDDLDPARRDACGACAAVDFLVVIDTSPNMESEQMAFASQLPAIVQALATGDVDGDGTPESEPIEDLHVGVVTADMGTGGYAVPTCLGDPEFGDDGVLRNESRAPMCAARTFPAFLEFSPDETMAMQDQFAMDWQCLIAAGTSGCGFEQPLEAALKAITPAASALRFHNETLGHADGLNRGFLRDGSLLVVTVITSEDDCSAANPDIFDPASSEFAIDLNLRCAFLPDELHPISRYVSGFLAARPASDLLFGVVVGVPVDTVTEDGRNTVWSTVLNDPAMQIRVNGATGRLFPSCTFGPVGPRGNDATPPRRIIQATAGLANRGARTVVSSICDPMNAYKRLVDATLIEASDRTSTSCLSAP